MAYDPTQLEQYKTSDPLFYAIASFNQSQDPNQSGGLATFLQATGKYPSLEGLNAASQAAGLGKYYPDGVSGSTRNRAFFNARDAQIISYLQQQAIAQKNSGATLGQVPISPEDQAAARNSGSGGQSGSSVTQTYTLNGQTFTTPPGGAVPVGGTKISDSTGTYTPVPQTTQAEPMSATTQIDPYTGLPVKSGGTQSSTIPTTQTGGSNPILSGQLSLNSTDTAGVKALQTYLNSQGAHLTVDGKFGPLTQAAVKSYQTQNGLQADGIVGPQTMAKINGGSQAGTQSVGLAPKPADDPSNQYNTDTGQPNAKWTGNTQNNSQVTFQSTGNPQVDAALANMQKLIDQMSKTGQIPPGLQVTDTITSQFLAAAHQAVDPYTQQQIKSAVNDLNANLANQGTQFQNQQGQLIQDFGTNLATEQNNAGANGTAFGGQRAINELNLANSTNRSLASLGSQTAYNIGGALRTGAGQVGADNASQFNTPNLNLNTVGITGGQRGNVSNYGTLGYNYNPSQYTVGSLTDTGTQNVGNTYANYLSRYNQLAANQSNSGRTWQDLANQAITSGNIGSQ